MNVILHRPVTFKLLCFRPSPWHHSRTCPYFSPLVVPGHHQGAGRVVWSLPHCCHHRQGGRYDILFQIQSNNVVQTLMCQNYSFLEVIAWTLHTSSLFIIIWPLICRIRCVEGKVVLKLFSSLKHVLPSQVYLILVDIYLISSLLVVIQLSCQLVNVCRVITWIVYVGPFLFITTVFDCKLLLVSCTGRADPEFLEMYVVAVF